MQQQKTADKKKFQDKADLVDILEHTLENKTSELERVKGELEKIRNKETDEPINSTKGTVHDIEYQDLYIASTSGNTQLKCDVCENLVSEEYDMESHVRMYHVLECTFCDSRVGTKKQLEKHVNKMHILRLYLH